MKKFNIKLLALIEKLFSNIMIYLINCMHTILTWKIYLTNCIDFLRPEVKIHFLQLLTESHIINYGSFIWLLSLLLVTIRSWDSQLFLLVIKFYYFIIIFYNTKFISSKNSFKIKKCLLILDSHSYF